MDDLRFPSLLSDYSAAALCQRIYDRHRDKIRIKKQGLAVDNLVKITGATLRLSEEKGFHATSMRDLCDATGLSMGGIYAYFRAKEDLLTMILNVVSDCAAEVLDGAPDDLRADPIAHLRWALRRHIELTEIMQPWFFFAYMEARFFPKGARAIAVEGEAQTEEKIARILEACRAGRTGRDGTGALSAALIKPMLQDWYIKRNKYRRRGVTVDEYANALCDVVENGML